jgi:Flp pilus assembly protein TadD
VHGGLALLHKAVQLQPGFADAWYNIGHAYEQLGRVDDACAAYEKAARADPNYPDPLYNLGMIALDRGRYPEAVAHFEGYLRLDPAGDWAARARKALALARMSLVRSANS